MSQGSGSQRLKTLLAGFGGRIEAVPISPVYRLGLLFVALAMLLLPLVYIGLIGLVGYGVYHHAVGNTGMLYLSSRHGSLWAFLLFYLGPLVVGVLLVLFMIKPLFARPAQESEPHVLLPEDEPVLFGFVARLCDVVGAPAPRRIQVDCEVNASAGFRRGLRSLLAPGDLVLTIGLPLAAGLELRALAGVLAHEFGHFAQSAGMRLTYVIRSVNAWFARVVHERDELDEQVVRMSHELDLRIGVLFYAARLFIWLVRGVLHGLMLAGHGISCFMLRQMEFDADRYEARLAGSDVFEATARRIGLLGLAAQVAQGELADSWQERRLVDDYPRLVGAGVERLPEATLAALETHLEQARTGPFDTHPADRDRIASARGEAAPGVFRLEQPASALFADFDALSRQVSREYYARALGQRIKPEHLVPVQEFLGHRAEEEAQGRAAGRYFQGQASPRRPLPLPRELPAPQGDAPALAAELRALRGELERALPDYGKRLDEFLAVEDRLGTAWMGDALLAAGFRVEPGAFGLWLPTREAASAAREELRAELGRHGREIEQDEERLARRMVLAFQLLGPDERRELPVLLAAAADFQRLVEPVLLEIKLELCGLQILLAQVEQHSSDEELARELVSRTARLHRRLTTAQETMRKMRYPFEHAEGAVALARYAFEGSAMAEDDLEGVYRAASALLDRLVLLYRKVYGRMALIAERVEERLGLPPLPEPEPAS